MSAGEITGLDYVEDAGPGFTELPAAPPPVAELPSAEPPAYPGWTIDQIELFLRGTGAGIHQLVGRADRDWLMVTEDLERMAPPLHRICNRWEPALRISPAADPIMFAYGSTLYAWRSLLEARRAGRDAELIDDRPGYVDARQGPEPDETVVVQATEPDGPAAGDELRARQSGEHDAALAASLEGLTAEDLDERPYFG